MAHQALAMRSLTRFPWPYGVTDPPGLPIGGAVPANQVKSIDRAARQLKIAGRAPRVILVEVQTRIDALLGLGDS
jgi:hypothetical protein